MPDDLGVQEGEIEDDRFEEEDLGSCFAAAIENRAKEVGIAVLDLATLRLELCQFVEPGRLYTSTLLHLTPRAPRQVVVVGTAHHEVAGSSSLNAALRTAGLPVLPAHRSSFDDTRGCMLVEEACSADCRPAAAAAAGLARSHYLAYGAAGALLQHLAAAVGAIVSPGSLRVEHGGSGLHHMTLDHETVTALELLRPLPRASPGGGEEGGGAAARAALALAAAGAAGRGAVGARGGGGSRGAPGGGRHARVAAADSKRFSSLLAFLDHTSTACGTRLLRTNILQPMTDASTIRLRLDALQELLESPHMALDVAAVMEQLPPQLDKMCCNLAITRQRPASGHAPAASQDPTAKIATLVDAVVRLRCLLRALPVLSEALNWVDTPLLKAVRTTLEHPELAELLSEVEGVLQEEAQVARGATAGRMHQVWAVRSNVDPFLDLARSNFNKLTDSINELAEKHREEDPSLAGLKAKYTNAKGWHFALPQQKQPTVMGKRGGSNGTAAAGPATPWSAANLPKGFLLLEQRGRGAALATTRELSALNARLRDAAADAIALCMRALEGLVGRVLGRMPVLLQVIDGIALLDVVLSFFHTVSGSPHEYVRPAITTSGPLAITAGRHPLLEALLHHRHGPAFTPTTAEHPAASNATGGSTQQLAWGQSNSATAGGGWGGSSGSAGGGGGPSSRGGAAVGGGSGGWAQPLAYAPNDTYISEAASLHLITGPNMAGKSTYLKQVALLAIMAQIGCYVPASFMSITPFDRVFTRIGCADCIESNASSFMVEMAETASIVAHATCRSLVLIDELGRATSTVDGVSIAWAVCEYLLTLGCPALLATHFRQLEGLAAMYPSCRLWRMQVDVAGDALTYRWALASVDYEADSTGSAGSTTLHYGIALARALGVPRSVLARAEQVAALLELEHAQRAAGTRDGAVTGGGGSSSGDAAALRVAYSLVHRLGCIARQAGVRAASDRTANDSSSNEAVGGAAGSSEEGSGSGKDGGGGEGSANVALLDPDVLAAVVPLLRDLKSEAERLCFR